MFQQTFSFEGITYTIDKSIYAGSISRRIKRMIEANWHNTRATPPRPYATNGDLLPAFEDENLLPSLMPLISDMPLDVAKRFNESPSRALIRKKVYDASGIEQAAKNFAGRPSDSPPMQSNPSHRQPAQPRQPPVNSSTQQPMSTPTPTSAGPTVTRGNTSQPSGHTRNSSSAAGDPSAAQLRKMMSQLQAGQPIELRAGTNAGS